MRPRPLIVASVRDVVRRSASPQRVAELVEIFEKNFDSVPDPRRSRARRLRAKLCRLGSHQVACPLHRLCRGARSVAAVPRHQGAPPGRERRGRRVGRRRRRRCAAAARRPPGTAEDGAGRSDVAAAGRREHAGVRAGSTCRQPGRRDRTGTSRLHHAAGRRGTLDLAGRLQHHHRDIVLRRPCRPRALRHGTRDRAGRSRGAAGRTRHGGRRAAGHAVAREPGRRRRAGPGRPFIAELPAV